MPPLRVASVACSRDRTEGREPSLDQASDGRGQRLITLDSATKLCHVAVQAKKKIGTAISSRLTYDWLASITHMRSK